MCPIRLASATLTEGNIQALALYGLLARRIVVDFHLSALAFELAGCRVNRADGIALLDQLSLIHEMRNPVKRG